MLFSALSLPRSAHFRPFSNITENFRPRSHGLPLVIWLHTGCSWYFHTYLFSCQTESLLTMWSDQKSEEVMPYRDIKSEDLCNIHLQCVSKVPPLLLIWLVLMTRLVLERPLLWRRLQKSGLSFLCIVYANLARYWPSLRCGICNTAKEILFQEQGLFVMVCWMGVDGLRRQR